MTWGLRRFRTRSISDTSHLPTPTRSNTLPVDHNFNPLARTSTYIEEKFRGLPSPTSQTTPKREPRKGKETPPSPSSSSKASSVVSTNKDRKEKEWVDKRKREQKERNMAAAVVHKMMHGKEERANERDFVAHYDQNHQIMEPAQVAESARDKGLGQSSKNLRVDDFDLVRTLGTGTFARVWLVRLRHPSAEADKQKVFALKVLRKQEVVRLKQVEHVNQERAILADVAGHPFITTLITTFADHDSLYMLLDYCPGGEIFSYLRKAKRFSEGASRFYTAEIVLILEFLHETEGVAYRDLKPENILLDKDGHVKLVDFGFAKRVQDRETYTLCGTPEYLAPEVIQSQGHTTAVDWWALGILLYEFVTGYPPFWHQQPMEIYKQIIHKPISFSTSHTHNHPVSPEAQDLIKSLCIVDRTQRLGNIEGGARRVKEHEFFRGVIWEDVYYRRNRWEKGPIIPPVRYIGDAQCFDTYPDEDQSGRKWTRSDAGRWDEKFRDF